MVDNQIQHNNFYPVYIRSIQGQPKLVSQKIQIKTKQDLDNFANIDYFNENNDNQIWCFQNVQTGVLSFPNEVILEILYDMFPDPHIRNACALIRENDLFERFIRD